MWKYVSKFYLALGLLLFLMFLCSNYVHAAVFTVGVIAGAGTVSIYFDGLLGEMNHKEQRAWDWRPWWKGPYSR